MRAAAALGEIGSHDALEPLLLSLRDVNADVRRHVIGALITMADAESADRVGVMLKDTDWKVRMGAALILSAIGDEVSIRYLKNASGDENEYVRRIVEASLKKYSG
jgi:HEAT repeat protein